MHEGENQVHEGVNHMWRWEIKDYGGEIKGTRAKEEKKRLMGRIKGCRTAKGQHQLMRGKAKHEGTKG